LIVQAIEEALKGVERRQLGLNDLFLEPLGKGYIKKLRKWAETTFDDAALQELSQLTAASITRKPHQKVSVMSRAEHAS
jgi:hypothetical protein